MHYTENKQLNALLNDPGAACDLGVRLEELPMAWSLAGEIDLSKSRYAVTEWTIWDVTDMDRWFGEERLKELKPVMLWAREIVLADPNGKYTTTDHVRTSFLAELHRNCIFETANSLYILTETGGRRSMELKEAVKWGL
ncbi:MAG: hypothetical protein V7744_08945 [Pseudomonadales bacterium]